MIQGYERKSSDTSYDRSGGQIQGHGITGPKLTLREMPGAPRAPRTGKP